MDIKFDGLLDIATGKSRKQKVWKNKKVKWSALVEKLSVTHRTAETHAEYMASKPDRQDEIKDIGGFVGGYLVGGKRGNGHVGHRQVITLDIDRGSLDLWNEFQTWYDCAACIYTTHKHSSEAARMRLVIPLDREITADQYAPICRRIAEVVGIDNFTDVTTYEATRLMYWPSTSKDGDYFFAVQDGAFLNADGVLATYTNWKDSSEWPTCSVEKELVRSDIKRQQDPLEKPGIIGAFCRVYSIEEVIEKYLPDVYTGTADPGRYTYMHGSTAGGLVVYDNKFAYSHHGSDPVSGKLCNSFDLVRVHKFSGLLEGKDMEAMRELAASDKAVVKQLGVERIEGARGDFQPMAGIEVGETIEPDAVDTLEWLKDLDMDRKGNYVSSIDNIYRVLKNDCKLKDKLYFDEFENWLKVKGNLPWRVVKDGGLDFTDTDAACLAHYVERYGIPFTHLEKAMLLIRNDNKVHPVRDYINSLHWDGVERLDTLFVDYLGADDNVYVRSATRKTFMAAIARVFDPGVKFDSVLTLVGEEGIGKSTIIYRMAGNGKWFSDSLGDIHDKSGMESLRGIWIMEISELSGFNRADEEAIKRFISSPVDVYRPAYGRQQVRYPRQCIFIASSNKEDFLRGAHIHRRFIPIGTDISMATKDFYNDLNETEVGQMWAEAYTYYQSGESLDLTKEVKELAAKVREHHTEIDDRTGLISSYLNILLPVGWEGFSIPERISYIRSGTLNDFSQEKGTDERMSVTAAEIWCELLEKKIGDMSSNNTKFIHDIMKRKKGWEKVDKMKRFGDYGPQRWYRKKV